MMRRIAARIGAVLPLAMILAASPMEAQVRQQGSPIDDLLERAQNAYNDLNFLRADTLARQVLAIGATVSRIQRERALTVIAAAAFPDDPPAQRRGVATDALRQIVRTNLDFGMPLELTWPGLDALVEETKKNTFGIDVSADSVQAVVGSDGRGTLRVRSSRPGKYQLIIVQGDGSAVVVDSSVSGPDNAAEFTFAAMRDQRPLFASGRYEVVITGVDGASRDSITERYSLAIEAPPLQLASLNVTMDSTKLLEERTGRSGFKSIFPAIMVGAMAFALSNTLRAEGNIQQEIAADSKGVAIGVVLASATIAAGFIDRGRPIPANIDANIAYGEAFQKAIEDMRAENQRRITQYRTILRFNLEAR